MPYATKEEIYKAAKPLLPPYTDVQYIKDAWHEMATGDVNESLVTNGVYDENVTDIGNLLKLAEICFYLDIAKNARDIEFTTGDVREEVLGAYKKQYSNNMPMFFFSQGASRPFYQLLPTETFRMRAYKYVTAYAKAAFKNKTGYSVAKPVVSQDQTSRGYGWQLDVVDREEWF